MSPGTPRRRKAGGCFEINGGEMGVDQVGDTKYGSQAPLVSEVSRRYKVRFESEQGESAVFSSTVGGWFEKQKRGLTTARQSFSWLDWVCFFLPMMRWVRTYKLKQYLLPDLLAGMSVAALVVPQSMSYARLAGLPSVIGLYGAFVPVLCYAALGSSRHLAVGPVAVTSLLLGEGLPKVVGLPEQEDPNNPAHPEIQRIYNHTAIQVAFLAGCLYTLVGILRLGWVTNFLSHSVISGFMTGASVIIGLSQCKSILGYNTRPNPASTPMHKLPAITFPRHDPVHLQLYDLLGPAWRPYFQWREFVMGVVWVAMLLIMKDIGKRYSKRFGWVRAIGPLSVTILSIAITSIFRLYNNPHNIRIVGSIPQGLPKETVTWWFPMPANFTRLALLAVVICLIDVLESISIAKALAYKNRYELNPTQELQGLGIANLMGAAFNCYTTTGSFSRSAIMDNVGACTQLAGIISGVIVMVVLLCLTPLFRNMPQNAQAAIIISAVAGLFNYSEAIFLWKVNRHDFIKFDFVVFIVAAVAVMFAGVEIGLAISIGLSVLIALWKSAFPHTAVLGQLPDTTVYRNVKQYPEATEVDGLLLLRIDAPLYFANINPVREALHKYEQRALRDADVRGVPIRFIAIDLSPVTDIDASAVHFLKDWITDHKARGIQPVFANPSRQVVRVLRSAGLHELIGEEFITVRMNDAVLLCQELLAERGGAKAGKEPNADGLQSNGLQGNDGAGV
ncbi:hypothetical protein WJX81_001934 [Elliptochloris bilobata]|uniref:STAS domain-containing protein n=1 Tax=Elliptochloris bilobata TaxID=381761 RepID=A0AAW1SCG8_9CHLO